MDEYGLEYSAYVHCCIVSCQVVICEVILDCASFLNFISIIKDRSRFHITEGFLGGDD